MVINCLSAYSLIGFSASPVNKVLFKKKQEEKVEYGRLVYLNQKDFSDY